MEIFSEKVSSFLFLPSFFPSFLPTAPLRISYLPNYALLLSLRKTPTRPRFPYPDLPLNHRNSPLIPPLPKYPCRNATCLPSTTFSLSDMSFYLFSQLSTPEQPPCYPRRFPLLSLRPPELCVFLQCCSPLLGKSLSR